MRSKNTSKRDPVTVDRFPLSFPVPSAHFSSIILSLFPSIQLALCFPLMAVFVSFRFDVN